VAAKHLPERNPDCDLRNTHRESLKSYGGELFYFYLAEIQGIKEFQALGVPVEHSTTLDIVCTCGPTSSQHVQ